MVFILKDTNLGNKGNNDVGEVDPKKCGMSLRLWRWGGSRRLALMLLLLPTLYVMYIATPNVDSFLPSKVEDSGGSRSSHFHGPLHSRRMAKRGKLKEPTATKSSGQALTDFLRHRMSLLSHSRDTKQPDQKELRRLDPMSKVFRAQPMAKIRVSRPPFLQERFREMPDNQFFEDIEMPPELANLPPGMMNPKITQQYMEVMKTKKKKQPRPANSTEIKRTLQIVKTQIERDKEIIQDKSIKNYRKPEGRKEPLKIMLVSTWRSGSTLLGMLIDSHPGVFHHYEPLNYFGIKQIRSQEEVDEALKVIQNLYKCQYHNLTRYLNYTRAYPDDMMGHNLRVYNACKKGPNKNACFNATFLESACSEFPIHTMKLVRLRLEDTEMFLNDSSSDMKVLFLTRDPRAVMQSRYSSVKWCRSSPDCIQAAKLCQDMETDIQVSERFREMYPSNFVHVSYETLALDPYGVIPKLFQFLHLQYDEITQYFIKSHMFQNENSPWSTKRLASTRVNLWKQKLKEGVVRQIEKVCSPVINKLGLEILYPQ